ncbi:MAG: hypothetical protein J0I12_27255 [Candidatus Eremiobacteraeota bacterium]|nr:hypothetical protein [Candidatus Eremiobacteraeota bacterium]
MRNKLIVLLIFVAGLGIGFAASDAYQVSVNGHPSKIQVEKDKETLLVPITLPAAGENDQFTVTLHRDDTAKKVDVKIESPKLKLRGATDCYYCTGNGMCANDYPPGSGRNYSNLTDGGCNGTGRCYHCSGTGKL